MSYLLLLPHVRIESANAVSGLTWGFPSMTHFLGYVHALSRKVVDEFGVSFDGCAVVSHEQHFQMVTKGFSAIFTIGNFAITFNQQRNRQVHTALFIERGGFTFSG